jgi:hypothetical protein
MWHCQGIAKLFFFQFHKFIYFCNPFSENVRGHQCFFFLCITGMLASSSTGEKLKPLVIGKAKQPRCFKNINIDNLRVFCNKKKKH